MLWFYTRQRDSLTLETRYDNETLEYVGVLTYPEGHQETKRFATNELFRLWLVSVDKSLVAERWMTDGDPYVLPDGWPDTTPPR